MISNDDLASQALHLLERGGSPGDSASLDAGLHLGGALLALEPTHSRSTVIAVACSSALRSRYRWSFDVNDLLTANNLVEGVLAATEPSSLRPSLLAERSRVLVRLANVAQVAESLNIALPFPAGANEEALRLAKASAEYSLSIVDESTSAETADLKHALGVAYGSTGSPERAIEALRESVRLDPLCVEYRYDLARILDARGAATGNQLDYAEADEVLASIVGFEMTKRPKDAFEAARFNGYSAAQRQNWVEAADAYKNAVIARAHAHAIESTDERQFAWLYATGSVAADAALASINAGLPASSVDVAERAYALELVERLGAPEVRPQNVVEDQECLVYIVSNANSTAALVVDRASQDPTVVDLPAVTSSSIQDMILRYVSRYRSWTSTNSAVEKGKWLRSLDSTLQWLGEEVMQPILAEIPAAVSRITIIPGGPMALLPIHASNVEGSSLIESHSVRYTPSARALASMQDRACPAASNMIVSNPISAALPPLPAADLEATIAAAWTESSLVLRGDAPTLVRVERELANYSVLHFATHAVARFDNPLLSAVMLADEPLTLRRILQLRLEQTRLVVLSACETALQDIRVPEETFGLPFGFLQAGAQAVVGSLWAVGDLSTAILMARFYELLAGEGQSPWDSLVGAQRWMMNATGAMLVPWIEELLDRIVRTENPTSVQPLVDLSSELERQPNQRPFGHAYHWAAFGYYGA